MRWQWWRRAAINEAEFVILGDAPGSRKTKPLRVCNRWKVILPVFGVCVLIYMLYILSVENRNSLFKRLPNITIGNNTKLLPVPLTGCLIPELNSWDPSILPYIFKPKPISCFKNRWPPLVASNLTSLYIVQSAVPYYNSSIRCCYQPCKRRHRTDDKILKNKSCYIFSHKAHIRHEFVIVNCYVGKVKVYEDYHSFVPRKPHVEKRCQEFASRSPSFKKTTFSVLILGLDSVSRLNLHRQMPLTVALLKKMGAVEMLKYNKVGENTFLNLFPVLTGMDEHQLRNSCWPYEWSFIDNCSFVWNEYRDAGFRTAFAEESIDGIFTWRMKGFVKQPTDYYTRHFIKAMVKSIGTKKGTLYSCSGSRLTTEVYLHYVKKFATNFKFDRYFALFWSTTLSHDFLNDLNLADTFYKNFLLELQATRVLERTVLAVISDHGFSYGDIRLTYQGRLENRLPFLFLVFPESFQKTYPMAVAKVERNAHCLTTPFDLHETLRDVMRPAELLSEEVLEQRSQVLERTANSFKGLPRGISLFLPVPSYRTCEHAGINKHLCSCWNGTAVDPNDIMYYRSAHYLVMHINEFIGSSFLCHHLKLVKIHLVNQESLVYRVLVETKPGGALFEGTISHDRKHNKLSVIGFVSRVNRYGSQSWCVKNTTLKPYCFCKVQKEEVNGKFFRNHKNSIFQK